MQRRTFLKMTGAGATLLGSGSLLTACGQDGAGGAPTASSTRLGVQLYTLRDQVQSDVVQALADVAAAGYEEVELYGLGNSLSADTPFFGMSARDFAAALADVGLSAPISHIDGDAMNIAEIADAVQAIGGEHLIVAMAPDFLSFEGGEVRLLGITGRDQVDGIAERLNQQGEMARAAGIGFGYHNHHMEFEPLEDGSAFDYLFAQADADLVKMELDIGWTMVAGADPVDVLNRYAGRVVAVHIKDYDPSRSTEGAAIPVQAQIVEPGSGPTDFGPIMAALDATGVEHRFVEIDLAPEPLQAITRGYQHLTSL
jgi:sugar phosphate isomerase/epimerase